MFLCLAAALLIAMLLGGFLIDGTEGIKLLVDIFHTIIGILIATGVYAIYAYMKDKDDVDPLA